MLKLGLFVNNMSSSERNFCFMTQFNNLASNHNIDTRIFYQNICTPCIPLDCSIMPSSEVYGFHNGLLITTDIDTTLIAVKAPISSKIVYYMDDIEWMREGKQNFLYNLGAFGSPYVTIIAKSNDYAKCMRDYTGRIVSVVSNYNLEGIIQHGYIRNNQTVLN